VSDGERAVKRIVVALAYDDGRVEEVVVKPVAVVAAERHFKGNVPANEGTLWAAHWLLVKERGLALNFADWLESLAGVEEFIADPTQAPPAAPSPT